MENKENKPNNPYAFAYGYGTDQYERTQEGMTLRDYFAAKAMQAIISTCNGNYSGKEVSDSAYLTADAMLKERSKPAE